jgi:hypothetical protein
VLSSDVLKIKAADLDEYCFSTKKATECALIFGIYGKTDKGNTGSNGALDEFRYSFVAYTDLIHLFNNNPQTN